MKRTALKRKTPMPRSNKNLPARFGDGRLPARFWEKAHRGPGGCWLWTARVSKEGYGRFYFEGHVLFAHRVAYATLIGSIDEGLQADHLCRVRRCVNPSHLEPVTHRVNSLRGVGSPAVNARKTHCARAGHGLAGDNLYVNPRGERECRACRRESNRRRALRLRRTNRMSWTEVRVVVWDRCGGSSEISGLPLDPLNWHAHHRLLKSRGGRNEPQNALAMTPDEHTDGADAVHRNVAMATAQGWIVKSRHDPGRVPVRLWDGRLVRLTPYGGTEAADPEES